MSSTRSDNLPAIRTKIVATVGPASRSPEVLLELIDAGVNVFRLNFSHGTHEDHSTILSTIRQASRKARRHIAILQDLCGPKIRLGPIPGDLVECPLGGEFTLVAQANSDDPHVLTCSYRELPSDLKPGETVLFADGTVAMAVIDSAPGRARLKVTLPGRLRSRQGLNLPGSNLSVNALTGKDLADLDWTARNAAEVQYVGLSFVRSADDIAVLRRELAARRCPARVIVKIEKPQAVQNLEAIVAATDGVMIARGDLGVEMDVERVPAIQKRVIALCNQVHRPVITATQMLNSMEHSNRPTRAETTDVFNAVLDGTDAVMLSGETAVGNYPVLTVATMRRICAEAESHRHAVASAVGHARNLPAPASLAGFVDRATESMVDAACLAARQLEAPMIVAATESGRTAIALSNRRPSAHIVALGPSEDLARMLSVCWGVTPLVLPKDLSIDQELAFAIDWAKRNGLVQSGQHVVFVRGVMRGQIKSRAVLAHEVD
jgi:pyruvate kinase